jgi:hypothetical protein
MHIEIPCPYDCGKILTCIIDTVGDASVGMDPEGLEDVNGECIHAHAISEDLEEHGADRVKEWWPAFSEHVEAKLDKESLDMALDYMNREREDDDDYTH